MNREKSNDYLRFFNEAIEYVDKFETQKPLLDESTVAIDEKAYNINFLRDEMICGLNNLSDLLKSNPDSEVESLSEEEKEIFNNFIKFYRKCPICGDFNHFYRLKQLFFDDHTQILKEKLLRLMNLKIKNKRDLQINLGVPCCNCYNKLMKD